MSNVLAVVGLYLIIGIIFGAAFVVRGCKTVEPAATKSGIGFRLLILPASVALWPLLLTKWLQKARAA